MQRVGSDGMWCSPVQSSKLFEKHRILGDLRKYRCDTEGWKLLLLKWFEWHTGIPKFQKRLGANIYCKDFLPADTITYYTRENAINTASMAQTNSTWQSAVWNDLANNFNQGSFKWCCCHVSCTLFSNLWFWLWAGSYCFVLYSMGSERVCGY